MNNNYYQSLPQKRVSAGILLFNEKDELLIVNPTYKEHWSIPGGVVEKNESPLRACIRETKEEINLDIIPKFLCAVDYMPASIDKEENFQFLFYGGRLSKQQIGNITLQKEELSEYKFMKIADTLPLFGEHLRKRVAMCYKRILTEGAIYLESGNIII